MTSLPRTNTLAAWAILMPIFGESSGPLSPCILQELDEMRNEGRNSNLTSAHKANRCVKRSNTSCVPNSHGSRASSVAPDGRVPSFEKDFLCLELTDSNFADHCGRTSPARFSPLPTQHAPPKSRVDLVFLHFVVKQTAIDLETICGFRFVAPRFFDRLSD